MLGSYSQNVISAKARSMYGKRLTDKDYTELTRKRSVSEVAGYLKNETAYRTCLASINESLIHRGQLEQILRTELFNRYAKLCRYQTGKTAGGVFLHSGVMQKGLLCVGVCNPLQGDFAEAAARTRYGDRRHPLRARAARVLFPHCD